MSIICEIEQAREIYNRVFQRFISEWVAEEPDARKSVPAIESEIRDQFYAELDLDRKARNWFQALFAELLEKSQ